MGAGAPTASLLCFGPYPQTSQDVGGGEPRSETHTDLGNELGNLWAEIPPPLHALDGKQNKVWPERGFFQMWYHPGGDKDLEMVCGSTLPRTLREG